MPSDYVFSVQPFSITIPNGGPTPILSASQLISPVGSLAFIIWDHNQSTGTTNTSISAAAVTLTNPGLVTATRNTSGVASIIAMGYVVDAKPTLVNSVQYGTVTIASGATTGTGSVTATNASYTSCIMNGYYGSINSFGCASVLPRVDVSGTTVTATRAVSAATTITVGYCIIEWNSAACAQTVQNFQRSWAATPTSETFSITTVNPDNTICFYGGGTLAINAGRQAMQMGQLINASQFRIDIAVGALGAAAVFNTSIVEFIPAVMRQPVQRGTITLNAVTSNTATIAALSDFGIVNNLGYTTSNAAAQYNTCPVNLAATNSTTITGTRNTATGIDICSYEAIDFSLNSPTINILGANILGATIL